MDPMQKISIHYANLTRTEKSTCDLITENPDIVIDNPIAEAAIIYDVSPSSILRLSKKLGYKGYSEFRYALESYKNHKANTLHENALYGRVLDTYKTSLSEMNNCIDEEKMLQLVTLLKTKNVITVGVGNSSLPAQQFIYSFYMYNRIGKCINDTVQLGFLDQAITKDYVVIIFSVSGNNAIYRDEVKKWKAVGVTIVLITTNPESTLIQKADLTFILPSLPIAILTHKKQPKYLENRSIFFIFIDIIMAYYPLQE